MAQDSETPTAADKGKGKAVDKSTEDKPALNGKKEDDEKKDGTGTDFATD
jgi:26S proteasome regulatory subunit N1